MVNIHVANVNVSLIVTTNFSDQERRSHQFLWEPAEISERNARTVSIKKVSD
jgi:hypothetical protein